MILTRLPLVVPDGSGPLPVPAASFGWTWGDDVVIPVALKRANGQPYPLTGPVTLTLAFKEHEQDPNPVLARSVVITNPALGEGEFHVSRSDRGVMLPGYFTAGVQFQDDNIGIDRRDTVLRPSRVAIVEGIADLDQPVSVPPSEQPLAQGPPGVIRTRTRETSNVVLSGFQTLNGVSLGEGDGVLLLGQVDFSEDGVWTVHSGPWTRPGTFNAGNHAGGLLVIAMEGSVDPDSLWICSTDPPADIIDSDPLEFFMVLAFGGITEVQHRELRQLIHFVDDGPALGFPSGSYRESLPVADPFPTSITWWESSAKLRKIVDKTIARNPNQTPSIITWRAFSAVDGSTVTETLVTAISYSGVFEISRTRTIS